MTTIKESFYGYVRDIPDDYNLIDASQDIESLCDHIGLSYEEYEGVCFFVDISSGDYDDILYCMNNIPHMNETVYRISIEY